MKKMHKKTLLGMALAISFFAIQACQQPVKNQARPETTTPTVDEDKASGSQLTDSTEIVQDSTSL